jgi:ABC-2 type transport system permease protein
MTAGLLLPLPMWPSWLRGCAAAVSFWTLQGLELMSILNFGGSEAAEFPVHIYGRWLRRIFLAFVPIATVSYFPVLTLLHKPDPCGFPLAVHLLSPLAGPLFLLVVLSFWRLALRRYASTGS